MLWSALLNGWSAGRAAILCIPRECTIGCNLITRCLWPVPVMKFASWQSWGYLVKDRINTSVSGEWILISVAPWAGASTASSKIFVSASSWVLQRCATFLCVASQAVPQAAARRFPMISAWSRAFLARYPVSSSLVLLWKKSFFIATLPMWVESVIL